MASSSGTSSGSTSLVHNSGSDGDLRSAMDQKKRKRMQSNRESARRSRMRKQKHLDELMTQVNQLRKENGQILSTLSLTQQHCLAVEAENSVLRTQTVELSARLQSLNEIIGIMSGTNNMNSTGFIFDEPQITESFANPWNNTIYLNQPVMASVDMFQYC